MTFLQTFMPKTAYKYFTHCKHDVSIAHHDQTQWILVQEACLRTASQLCADGCLASEVPRVVMDQANCIQHKSITKDITLHTF